MTTTPLSAERLAEIRERCEAHGPTDGDFGSYAALAHSDRIDLTAEVDRLRDALAEAERERMLLARRISYGNGGVVEAMTTDEYHDANALARRIVEAAREEVERG